MADDKFKINNPQANQILTYNEIQGKFVNITPDLSIFGANNIIEDGLNIGSGESIFNDIVSNRMRFKTIRGSDEIKVANKGSTLEIQFTGEASTLGGIDKDGYLQTNNALSDVDAEAVRQNIEVYSKDEAHDNFLEANASNIPDIDNEYDLGSNGRRFANIFAATFHGHATEAGRALSLDRMGASDGQILVWRTEEYDWVAETPTTNRLNNLQDVDTSNIQHESVLLYNGIRSRWETVSIDALGTGGGENGGGGDVIDAENIGSGVGVYVTRIGGILQLRSITGGDNVEVSTSNNDEEIVIDVDAPSTTDDLDEGDNNLYFTNQRVADYLINVSIQDLGLVDGEPTTGQSPVWNGSDWEFQSVAVDINDTDDLPEGNDNLYFTEQRAFDSIRDYIDSESEGISLNDLSDVEVESNNNTFLVRESGTWINRELNVEDLSDVDVSFITDGQYLAYDSENEIFVPTDRAQFLEDLDETASARYFNQETFDEFFETKTTEHLDESTGRWYLNEENLEQILPESSVGYFGDVNIENIQNGNILIWDSGENEFRPADSEDLEVNVDIGLGEINNVNSNSIDEAQNGYVLIYDESSSEFIAQEPNFKLIDLDDVSASEIEDGQGLVYDDGYFVNKNIVTYEDGIDENSILVFESDQFVPKQLSDVAVINFESLEDVDVDGVSDRDIIYYDGSDSLYKADSISSLVEVGTLGNVDLTNLSEHDVLVYDGDNFVNKAMPLYTESNDRDIVIYDENEGSFVKENIYSALNIDYSEPTNNSIFIYNSDNNTFEVSELSLDQLSDINIDGIEENQTIVWDGSQFTASTISSSINDLTDVDITGISTDQFLRWDGSEFIAHSLQIQDAENVVVNNVSNNEILVWRNDHFENESIFDFIPTSLSEFSEIPTNIFENIEDGQVLVWDAEEELFEARTIEAETISSITELDDVDENVAPSNNFVLTYNGSTEKYEPRDVSSLTTEFKPSVQEFNTSDGQSEFNMDHDGEVLVFANGILLPESEVDTSENDVVVLNTPRNEGDNIRIMAIHNPDSGEVENENASVTNADANEYTMSEGQTIIEQEHSGIVMVYANGILLPMSEVDASDTEQITLNTEREEGDTIRIVDLIQA